MGLLWLCIRCIGVCPQGKLGGCTVISCDVTLNYTTYYLSLWTTSLEAPALSEGARNANWSGLDQGKALLFLRGFLLWLCDSWNTIPCKTTLLSPRFGSVHESDENNTHIIVLSLTTMFGSRFQMYSRFPNELFKGKNTVAAIASLTHTYRYELAQTVTTSSDLRVCGSWRNSPETNQDEDAVLWHEQKYYQKTATDTGTQMKVKLDDQTLFASLGPSLFLGILPQHQFTSPNWYEPAPSEQDEYVTWQQ